MSAVSDIGAPPAGWQDIRFRDFLMATFRYLSGRDLFAVGVVCRVWREISEARELWEPHFREVGFAPSVDLDSCRAYFHLCCGLLDTFKEKKLTRQPLGDPKQPIFSVAFSTDGMLFATGSSSEITLWNAKSQACVEQFKAHTSPVTSLSFLHREGQEFLVSGSSEAREIKVWANSKDGSTSLVKTIQLKGKPPLGRVVTSQDYLGTFFTKKGSQHGEWDLVDRTLEHFQVWSIADWSSLDTITLTSEWEEVTAMAIDGEGTCVTASRSHKIEMHPLKAIESMTRSDRELAAIDIDYDELYALEFSSDDESEESSDGDSSPSFRTLDTGNLHVFHLALSRDFLIAGGYEGHFDVDSSPGYVLYPSSILVWNRNNLDLSRKISLRSDLDAMTLFGNLLITAQRKLSHFASAPTKICARDLTSGKKLSSSHHGRSIYYSTHNFGKIVEDIAFNGEVLLVGGAGSTTRLGEPKRGTYYTFGSSRLGSLVSKKATQVRKLVKPS